MSFDKENLSSDEASDDWDEYEDNRQTLFLDDKRFVVLAIICLAGIVNFVGCNTIQELR
jgi:hypothetical protein